MHIHLLRHGIADDARPGMPDADRALTAEGIRKLREVLKRARTAGVAPSLILTSPYVRARQTAEVAAEVLGYEEKPALSGKLVPMSLPQDTWSEIRSFRNETSLLLVGHEPNMSGVTAYLLAAPELRVDFKKGALVRIDMPEVGLTPRGILKWMMAPKLAL